MVWGESLRIYMSSSMRCRKGVIGRMIFMRRLLACMRRIKAASRDSHAADAGVIVGQRAQGGPDELYEVERVCEEEVLPERSERFSANVFMLCLPCTRILNIAQFPITY